MSVESYRQIFIEPSPKQQRDIVFKVLRKALPSAKRDLSIDEIRPLLYQNRIITHEEANELLGKLTGEEKITKLYTEILPDKGMQGLDQFMRILYDTGWDTPSHWDHHGVLLMNLKVSELITNYFYLFICICFVHVPG